ncbi:MAG: PilZ domain-containing protein [Myxococcota bacterium]
MRAEPKFPISDARRRYPRAELRVKTRLFVAADRRRQFEAVLPTSNISVGGVFLESTFFLKVGVVLEVELRLPPDDRLVRARGRVVRVEQGGRGKSGFAVKFEHYFDGSELVLAHYFLSPVLREFILGYAKEHRHDATPDYVAHLADVLTAWEFTKSTSPDALWLAQLERRPGEPAAKAASSSRSTAAPAAPRSRSAEPRRRG